MTGVSDQQGSDEVRARIKGLPGDVLIMYLPPYRSRPLASSFIDSALLGRNSLWSSYGMNQIISISNGMFLSISLVIM